MTFVLRGAIAATAFLLACGPALADCKQQQLLASVDLKPTSDGTANFIPVMMGTTPKTMLFDTGAAVSTITAGAADELQLKRMQGNLEMVDVAGQTSRDYVRVPVALVDDEFVLLVLALVLVLVVVVVVVVPNAPSDGAPNASIACAVARCHWSRVLASIAPPATALNADESFHG